MMRVYFARVVGTSSPIKIGCSRYPRGRCRQVGFDLATKIELLAEAPGDFKLERNLHLKFAEQRVKGPQRKGKIVPGASEWFAVSPGLLKIIKTAHTTGEVKLPIAECRERVIAARYKSGETLQQIGTSFGMTRERVRQILNSVGVERRSAAERAYIATLARRARLEKWLAERDAQKVAA